MSKAKPRRSHRAVNGSPDPIDVHVGNRVKLRRRLLGLTRVSLSANIGVTFQQLQKYETAGNRISASSLFRFSQALDVPVSFFFDGLENGGQPASDADRHLLAHPEDLEMLSLYHRISAHQRKCLRALIEAIANGTG